MAGAEDGMPSSPFGPLLAEVARMRKLNLNAAIQDVDSIIDLLTAAREQVAGDGDAHKISMAMTTLQNPVKARLEAITNDLKNVTKAQRNYGKALDRALPHRELPMEADAMADHSALINRAIAMHLLREGQFSVASTFLREEHKHREQKQASSPAGHKSSRLDRDGDDKMNRDGDDEEEAERGEEDMQRLHSEYLQDNFSIMYRILAELKERNLVPAIEWARANNQKLEAKGSNLEFELSKLQFVWLFKGPSINGLPDNQNNGQMGALSYARQHFARFQSRHIKEIQQLPMMLPCGHVLCRDSLHNIAAKGSRYKCPYCPTEGHLRDAIKITL